MFQLIDKTIDIIFFSINWKNYFDQSILVISMTVLIYICVCVLFHPIILNYGSTQNIHGIIQLTLSLFCQYIKVYGEW